MVLRQGWLTNSSFKPIGFAPQRIFVLLSGPCLHHLADEANPRWNGLDVAMVSHYPAAGREPEAKFQLEALLSGCKRIPINWQGPR